MIDDDLIRETLEARASASRPSLANLARAAATSHHSRSTRGGLRPAMSIAAATAAILVVAVALVVIPGRSKLPEMLDSGPPPNVVSMSPHADETPAPDLSTWNALTWYSGDDEEFEQPGHNVFIQSVEYWHGAWIAVGYSFDLASGSVAGLVLHSDDGRTWSRDPEQEDVQLDRLITTATDVYVLGFHRQPDIGDQMGPRRPAIWVSRDGRDWAELAPPPGIDEHSLLIDVAVGGQGWLLRTARIGVDRESWLVGDPSTGWHDVTLADGAFADAYAQDIVGTAEGWLAAGMTGADLGKRNGLSFGDATNDRGAIWQSTDGSNWSAARIANPGTGVVAIHRVSDGWIAVGGDHGGCPRCVGGRTLLWRSGDGRTWTPLDLDTSMSNLLGWGLVATDGRRGLLLDLDASGRLRVRETQDGTHWLGISLYVDVASAIKPVTGGVIGVGPNGVVSFSDPSTEPLDHFWMVPHAAIAGKPPASAATQSPAPPPENHDIVCRSGEPCGP